MKRRKKSTRKARHNRKHSRKTSRRTVRHNRKHSRKTSRRRNTRRNPVSTNPKRRAKKARRARRNPIGAVVAAVANPKRRGRKARRSSRMIRPLPTLLHRPVFHYRRPVLHNTMFATNPVGRSPLAPSTASKVGWRNRFRGRKGYKSAKKSRRLGKFLISRNPVAVGTQTFKANLTALFDLKTVTHAAQMTMGSIGSPLIGAGIARGVEKIGVVKTRIELDSPAGMACTAIGGVTLATVAALFSRGAMVENILLGTIGGLAADPAKKFLVPQITKLIGVAVAAPAPVPAEGAAEAIAAGEESNLSGFLAGPRADVAREVRGMSDYATASSIVRAAADEKF